MFANEQYRQVVDFGGDPGGETRVRGLFADLWARVQGAFVAPVVGMHGDPSVSFTGYGPQVQHFDGMGGGAPVLQRDGGAAGIDSGVVEGPYGDPARRIFADRLRRRA